MPDKSDIAQIVGSITSDVRDLAQGEVSLVREELKPVGKRAAIDVVFLLATVYFALVASVAVALILGLGFAWAIHSAQPDRSLEASLFLGAVIAFVLVALIAVICLVVFAKRAKVDAATVKTALNQFSANTKAALGALQEGLVQGQERVDAGGARTPSTPTPPIEPVKHKFLGI